MSQEPFVAVLPAAELPTGQMRCVEVGGVAVLLVHAKDGKIYAVNNICTHAYAKLDEGRLRANRLICPLHGWRYHARTGRHEHTGQVCLRTYAVRVQGDEIQVDPTPMWKGELPQ